MSIVTEKTAGKIASGMDSVFDQCTQDELDFDVMFDDEDSIIDTIAGVDEAGVPLTGPDFDWDSLLEADVDDDFDASDVKIPEDEDYNAEKNSNSEFTPAQSNGVRDDSLEKSGELGSAAINNGSAEANAYDDTKKIDDAIGLNDKEQVKLEDGAEGPLEDDDVAERNGATSDTAVNTESAPEVSDSTDVTNESTLGAKIEAALKKKAILEKQEYDMIVDELLESMSSDELTSPFVEDIIASRVAAVQRRLAEAKTVGLEKESSTCKICGENPCQCDKIGLQKEDTDPIADKCDTGLRAGAIKLSSSDTEGVGADVLGDSIKGEGPKEDPIQDKDDTAMRNDDAEYKDDDKVEGVDTKVVGAALEAVINKLMEEVEDPITDLDDADSRSGEVNDDQDNVEGADTESIGAALEATINDLLSDVGDDDDIDLDSIANNDKIVPDDIRESFSWLGEADEVDVDDLDDVDIEAIDNDEVVDADDPDLNYSYDDDELIDIAISGEAED